MSPYIQHSTFNGISPHFTWLKSSLYLTEVLTLIITIQHISMLWYSRYLTSVKILIGLSPYITSGYIPKRVPTQLANTIDIWYTTRAGVPGFHLSTGATSTAGTSPSSAPANPLNETNRASIVTRNFLNPVRRKLNRVYSLFSVR